MEGKGNWSLPKKTLQKKQNVIAKNKGKASSDGGEKKSNNNKPNTRSKLDPRFRTTPKKDTKVQVGERFKDMFTNEAFQEDNNQVKIDKYGFPKKQTQDNMLERLYALADYNKPVPIGAIEKAQEIEQNERRKEEKRRRYERQNEPEEEEQEEEEEVEYIDYSDEEEATGFHWSAESSSEETDIESEESDDEIELDPKQILDQESIPEGDETRRIAVVNLDWDHIKAVDLFHILQTFVPQSSTGHITKISILPSNFGLERMKKEQEQGPTDIWNDSQDPEQDSSTSKSATNFPLTRKQIIRQESETFNQAKLRKYQLERLKYYYAVIECTDKQTALQLYNSCDGLEIEQTSNKLDMRFIPDDVVITNTPRDEATSAPVDHVLPQFDTKALQHTRVKLTWDQDDPERLQLTKKLRDESIYSDNAYLPLAEERKISRLIATSDSESSDDSDSDNEADNEVKKKKNARAKVRQKYSSLLCEIHDSASSQASSSSFGGEHSLPNQNMDMEITFTPGLTESVQELVETVQNPTGTLTPWEQYQEKVGAKKSEKKRTRKQKLQKQADQDAEEREKAKKRRRKIKKNPDKDANDDDVVDPELELLMLDSKLPTTLTATTNTKKSKRAEAKQRKQAANQDVPLQEIDDRFSKVITNAADYAYDITDPQYDSRSSFIRSVHKQRAEYRSKRAQGQAADKAEPSVDVKSLVAKIKQRTKRPLDKKEDAPNVKKQKHN